MEEEGHPLGRRLKQYRKVLEEEGEGDRLEPDLREHRHPGGHLLEGNDERKSQAYDGDQDRHQEADEGAAEPEVEEGVPIRRWLLLGDDRPEGPPHPRGSRDEVGHRGLNPPEDGHGLVAQLVEPEDGQDGEGEVESVEVHRRTRHQHLEEYTVVAP